MAGNKNSGRKSKRGNNLSQEDKARGGRNSGGQ